MFELENKHETYMTLCEDALQALTGLSTLGATCGSCCGVCACGVVDARGVGTGEVVCRHGGDVWM